MPNVFHTISARLEPYIVFHFVFHEIEVWAKWCARRWRRSDVRRRRQGGRQGGRCTRCTGCWVAGCEWSVASGEGCGGTVMGRRQIRYPPVVWRVRWRGVGCADRGVTAFQVLIYTVARGLGGFLGAARELFSHTARRGEDSARSGKRNPSRAATGARAGGGDGSDCRAVTAGCRCQSTGEGNGRRARADAAPARARM